MDFNRLAFPHEVPAFSERGCGPGPNPLWLFAADSSTLAPRCGPEGVTRNPEVGQGPVTLTHHAQTTELATSAVMLVDRER